MKKNIILLILLSLLLVGNLYLGKFHVVRADWWERPTTRPTQPSLDRGDISIPTQPPPTQPPAGQPTVTTAPPVGGLPTSAPTSTSSGDGGTSEDPCAAGKSYTGSYCGWSPEKDQPATSGDQGQETRIGGPSVLGLSYTGGSDLKPSDIILLTGVLCLLLYLRSKLPKAKTV